MSDRSATDRRAGVVEPVAGGAYDACRPRPRRRLVSRILERSGRCIVPPRSDRIVPIPHDPKLYTLRHRVENMFARLNDWRRAATRYDRCTDLYQHDVTLNSRSFLATSPEPGSRAITSLPEKVQKDRPTDRRCQCSIPPRPLSEVALTKLSDILYVEPERPRDFACAVPYLMMTPR